MQIKAFAKLNLTLDITGKREDGYHLLDSLMLSVEPYDIVTLQKADKITIECSDGEISNEDNIAVTAAKRFFEYSKINGGARINIEKHIPKAAGMGGGSADAAAVICGLNQLYETSYTNEQLCEIGLLVGADVPFCIVGGAARVQGIGEKIEPLKTNDSLYFVIVKNGIKASTKDAYQTLDGYKGQLKFYTPKTVDAWCSCDFERAIKSIGNAFINAVGLYDADKILLEYLPKAISLSGSGPSVFAVFDDLSCAQECFEGVKKTGIECYLSKAMDKGIIIE